MSETQNNNPEQVAQISNKGARQIEAMKEPGFHIGKIDSRTLDRISEFGLKIEHGKDKEGISAVILNGDGKLTGILETGNGEQSKIEGGIMIDKDTLKLSVYALKQDGFSPRPGTPLRLMSQNKDGTTDYITFEQKKPLQIQGNNENPKIGQEQIGKENTIEASGKKVQTGKAIDSGYGTEAYTFIIIDNKQYTFVEGSVKRYRGSGIDSTYSGPNGTVTLRIPQIGNTYKLNP